MKIPLPTEHQEQVLLFDRIRFYESRLGYASLRFITAIPNGGARHPAVAGKLKAEGVRRGTPDICIPIASGGFGCAWIEMKRKPNKPSPEQLEFMEFVSNQGHAVKVAYSADEAWTFIREYLLLPNL